jgi:CheY-like chemotaxis protein
VESNLYVAKRLLDPYDLSLETTSNGFEAIEEVKRGKIYDIIFMDHMMPGMDGIETTKIIRDLGYKHPIVALTANAIAGQAEIFLKNGFDGFIFKPIDTRQLNAELNRFIRDKRIAPVPTKTVSTVNTKLLAIFAQDAKRCLPIFEKMLENATDATDEDWELFTINAHGMKSALANIGETELSEIALALEKTSNVRDKNTIGVLTQELVNSLKKILA